jgi:YVTN family beta-propeller protein
VEIQLQEGGVCSTCSRTFCLAHLVTLAGVAAEGASGEIVCTGCAAGHQSRPVTHALKRFELWARGRLASLMVTLTMLLPVATVVAALPPARSAPPQIHQARPAVEGNRAPEAIVFSPDGELAYVTEAAEGQVAVVSVSEGKVLRRIETGGNRPVGLALTPDGRVLLVANCYSGTVAIIDAAAGTIRSTVSLPGMPWGVVAAPDGARAYVTLSQLDEVAALDLERAEVIGRLPVGQRPRALALTPDGATLAVAALQGGTLSVIDTAGWKESARVRLKGINVRGVAVTPDGAEAFTTLMPAFNTRQTDDPQEIWHNLVQAVRLEGEESAPGEDQWLDFARVPGLNAAVGSPDGHDIVMAPSGRHAWFSVSGRDVVTRITINDRRRDAIWPISQIEVPVGAVPRGLALHPSGESLWVANHLGNSLSVIDTRTLQVVREIGLGPASRVDPSIAGQYLFQNAGLTRHHRFSCNSCHPDGGSDGLSWRFVHVDDGVPRRNSRDLRGGVPETPPFRWSGLEAHLDEFIDAEVTGLLYGPKPTGAQVRALEAAVAALRLPPNPHRRPDGSFTDGAEQGRILFEGKAGCASCHSGARFGGTGKQAWVSTTPESLPLDVPHLVGVYDSAPYLHDGRAPTLEAIFERFNAGRLHGAAHLLNAEELRALLQYVREL